MQCDERLATSQRIETHVRLAERVEAVAVADALSTDRHVYVGRSDRGRGNLATQVPAPLLVCAHGRADLVAERLRTAIALGVLAENEQLPSESELAAQFNVSPVTLREALAQLRVAADLDVHSYVDKVEHVLASAFATALLDSEDRVIASNAPDIESGTRLAAARQRDIVVRVTIESLGWSVVALGEPLAAED